MIINIEVKNRIATYVLSGANPVCGSNTDVVRFSFDDEWDGVDPKTARFIWNDQYYDVEFTGNTCPVPMFFNVTKVLVGVYAGEPVVNEPSLSSTKAVVPYELSVRCGYVAPNPESGEGFTNEAKGYAQAARTAADEANAAAERVESTLGEAYGMKVAGSLSLSLSPPDWMSSDEHDYVWKLGGVGVNEANGTVLLCARNGFSGYTFDHPNYGVIQSLMDCNLTKVTVEHPDLNNVMITTLVYSATCGGVRWVTENDVNYDSDFAFKAEENTAIVPHLIVTDNCTSPDRGYGPMAVYLALPEDLFSALSNAGMINEEYGSITVTLTGYN